MSFSKTKELRNTKAKIKDLESRVALLESDLELSDTLYKTYQRIQDETEADLNESELSVDSLIAASFEDSSTIDKLQEEVAHYKCMAIVFGVFGLVLAATEVLLKTLG